MIDHLTDRRNESGGTDGVAYIYFGYQDQNQQKPIDVISIFIRQLLVQLQELPSDIESPFDMMAQNGSPNYDTLKGFIFSLSKRFSKQNGQAFIVCDALDEMDEHGQRQELLPLLHEMKNAGIKLFLTSRPHPADVRISFADSIQLELTPHTDDLKKYIAQKLAGNTCTYRLIEASRSLDMEDVISALVASAEGMYVWCNLLSPYDF